MRGICARRVYLGYRISARRGDFVLVVGVIGEGGICARRGEDLSQ